MTIYNIIFIIDYIVCIIIYLLMLVLAKTIMGNYLYKPAVQVKSYCSGAPYLTPYKNGIFSC